MKKLVLATLLLHIFTVATYACSCIRIPTPYEGYKEAQTVFIGKVVSSEEIPYDEIVGSRSYRVHNKLFKFVVTEVLKGDKISEININAGRTDSSCYRGFAIGTTYLVYASDDNESSEPGKHAGVMYSGYCTRTNQLDHAADDIIYLRGLLAGKPEPALYGSVSRIDNEPNQPAVYRVNYLKGITVVAEGNGKKYSTITDENGLYSLRRLSDGDYKVRAVLPDKYMHYWFNDENVTINRRRKSAFAEFSVGWNNLIAGQVVDEAGNPVQRAVVRLLPVDSPADAMLPNVINISDHLGAEGKYRITGKTPGRYLLAVEVYAPFTSGAGILRTYYPQATSAQNGSIITLGEVDKLHLDLKLTSDQRVRLIKGVMVWSDGTPVAKDGWVFLEKLENSEDEANVRYDLARVDEQGNFQLQVFENAQYWLFGSVNTYGMKAADSASSLWDSGIRDIRSKPIVILGSQTTSPLKIVIPLPEGVTPPRP